MTHGRWGSRSRRWLPWVGVLIGIATLAWILRGFDLDKFRAILAGADARLLLAVPAAVAAEQLARAWKWRQLLHPLRSIGTFRLFGAIMAGYLVGFLIPFGFSTLARAWLVGRREAIAMSAVLATVALDRLTDGIVFALLVPLALLLVAFPDPTGDLRAGLAWAAAGSLVLCVLLIFSLVLYKHRAMRPGAWFTRLIGRLPAGLVGKMRRAAASFGDGIVWPREHWRRIVVVVASVVIKALAATHFFWAGLAFGAVLEPAQYFFLMVCLGFVVVLGHLVRVAGTFAIGAIFVLGLFGVSGEMALAMVLVVQAATILTMAIIGAFALWRQGVALSELRTSVAEQAGVR